VCSRACRVVGVGDGGADLRVGGVVFEDDHGLVEVGVVPADGAGDLLGCGVRTGEQRGRRGHLLVLRVTILCSLFRRLVTIVTITCLFLSFFSHFPRKFCSEFLVDITLFLLVLVILVIFNWEGRYGKLAVHLWPCIENWFLRIDELGIREVWVHVLQ
jgi:hypothetical protein